MEPSSDRVYPRIQQKECKLMLTMLSPTVE